MSQKRKYNEAIHVEKLNALKDIDQGMTVRKVAEKYHVATGTVSGWTKKKDQIIDRASTNVSAQSKRPPRINGNGAIIDERVYNWFAAARASNIPVSGVILQEKARKVAELLNECDFKASNGWLDSFRKRHNIVFRTLSGESAEMDRAVVQNWKDNLHSTLQGYQQEAIWNVDETGLFWRGLPTRSLVLQGENAKGGKLAKERVTVCLLTSATGEKFKPFVIGKAAMPRAFNGRLPTEVYWKSNKKAWMTASFFTEYLQIFNAKMTKEGRNAVLLLDNATCHPDVTFSNVKLMFLPPNTTAGCQPLDAGIIKNFKVFYRSALLQWILGNDATSNASDMVKSVSMKHACRWIASAWASVKADTIAHCFSHCGVGLAVNVDQPLLQEETHELHEMVVALRIEEPLFVEENVDVCASMDDGWEQDILNPNVEDALIDDEESVTQEEVQALPSLSDALSSLRVVSKYALYNDLGPGMQHLVELERILTKTRVQSLKQNTLHSFLKMN